MRKIVITGAAGFIATHFLRKYADLQNHYVLIDNFIEQVHGPNASWNPLLVGRSNIELKKADISDIDEYSQHLIDADVLLHLAAETGTGQSMTKQSHYYGVNVLSSINIIEYLSKNNPNCHVIFASSRSVYGEGAYRTAEGTILTPEPRTVDQLMSRQWEPTDIHGNDLILTSTSETSETKPASLYASTKLAVEDALKIVSSAFNIKCTCLRFQNVYGPEQSLLNPYTGIISIFSQLLRQNKPLNIFEDGRESRDFIFVEDVADAIQASFSRHGSLFEVCNIGTGSRTSIMQIATILKNAWGSNSELAVTGDFRVGDIRHCYADITKAKALLNFSPKISIEHGIEQFVNWAKLQNESNTQ